MYILKKILWLLIVFSIFLTSSDNIFAQSSTVVPKFTITGEYQTSLNSSYSILVARNTTDKQLSALIYEFRNSKGSNNIKKYFPTWKGKTSLSPFEVIVFTDPSWSTNDKLKIFIDTSIYSNTDLHFSRQYVHNIKAHYIFTPAEEWGEIGFDDGMNKSPKHKQLFHRKIK